MPVLTKWVESCGTKVHMICRQGSCRLAHTWADGGGGKQATLNIGSSVEYVYVH